MRIPSGRKLRVGRAFFAVFVGLLLVGGVVGCGLLEKGFAPPTPNGVSATDGVFTDRVRVTWNPVPEAKGYEVWRASAEDGDYSLLTSTAHTSHDDKSAVPGNTYWYRVRACARAGCSEYSPAQRGQARLPGVPPPPSGVTATLGEYGDRVVVNWQPEAQATEYSVYRALQADGPFTVIAEVSEAEYDDDDVASGKTYWYAVRACSDEGCSPRSEPVSGSTAGVTVSAPQGVSATEDEEDMIVVTWESVEDALSYLVYRAPEEEATYLLLGSTEATSYEDGDVEAETPYWYKLRACDGSGCSPLSDPVSGTAVEGEDEGPPPPPGS